jgi:hypothetical protein
MHDALVARVLQGDGEASHAQRRAASDNAWPVPEEPMAEVVGKVARRAHRVTDADFAAARASGLGEAQLFELVVCAAIGQATRQYETALAALEAAAEPPGRSDRAPHDPR